MTNRSLKEKSAARLAAAQLVYQAWMNGEAVQPKKLLAHYADYQVEDDVPPNKGMLAKLLEGVETHAEALEPLVEKLLTENWKKERMSKLMLAILTLGVFELAHFRETKAGIIISEYVSLAERFFSTAESKFVFAALKQAEGELR